MRPAAFAPRAASTEAATAEAEICLVGPGVARRHAEVFADAGAFWISDLGSTSSTFVNGKELGRTPHELEPGDVIRVGDVELRYEQAPLTKP